MVRAAESGMTGYLRARHYSAGHREPASVDCLQQRPTSKIPLAVNTPSQVAREERSVSRDNEPVPGQWYQNVEEEETFRVLTVDEDSELIEIEYLDGDIEELDVEAWHEMDLELTSEPEGWSDEEDEDEDEEKEEDDDEDEDDDDWDDDDDDDLDDDEEQDR
jgi:hypothetical protein